MTLTCPLKGCMKIHVKNLMFVIIHVESILTYMRNQEINTSRKNNYSTFECTWIGTSNIGQKFMIIVNSRPNETNYKCSDEGTLIPSFDNWAPSPRPNIGLTH
jgi:hypothetical protein